MAKDMFDRLVDLKLALLDVPDTSRPSWVFDADTFKDIMRRLRDVMEFNTTDLRNELVGLPYRLVCTEDEITTPDFDATLSATAVAKRMPVLIALEYTDHLGLVRYIFDDETDARFKPALDAIQPHNYGEEE